MFVGGGLAVNLMDGPQFIEGRPVLRRPNGRQITAGRLLYLGWYRPRAFIRKCGQEGPLNLWLAAKGRHAMERAAPLLPPLGPAPGDAPAVFFLTGRTFWYQTAFCGHTLITQAGRPLRLVILDDGTLQADQATELRRIFRGVQIISADECDQKLDKYLPFERFPSLRSRRLVYPHLRKLIDVHVGEPGWKLVLDSDMLFFNRPQFLLDWLDKPDRPCHMIDVDDAYGYSMRLMTELAGAPIPRRLNVGVCGLNSETIDWNRLETWCKVTLEREGSHYLQEQAMVAMLMANQPRAVAPPDEYVVRPSRANMERPAAVLHHYVAESKAWYFRFGWRDSFLGTR
jgi:hypothetical protein